ncbi:hypothetical protein SLA2020_168760 [Shorea laevis]
MTTDFSPGSFSLFSLLLLVILFVSASGSEKHAFSIKEATIKDIQQAFKHNQLTSRQLVEFYLQEITRLNPVLKGVTEVNPDALCQADAADEERKSEAHGSLPCLHGIPILLKDNIATKDKLNTSAGSFALLGSVVPRDAGVVKKLREAGAIILGKASMSEWAHFGSFNAPNGWSARGDQGQNPYVLTADPFGLTNRAWVIPVSPRQDTIGPSCRTVSYAVYVLDAIVGLDGHDKATKKASQYIASGGYKQFLNPHGLKGKRLGIFRNPFFNFRKGSGLTEAFESHFHTLRERGAVLVDNLEIGNINFILNFTLSGETIALLAEFKLSLNAYLKELVSSPVQSLADVIEFNQKFSDLEMIKEYGQDNFLAAEATNGIGDAEKAALSKLRKFQRMDLKS